LEKRYKDEILEGLRYEFAKYSDLTKNALQKRYSFLETFSDAYKITRNTTKERALRKLMIQENQRISFINIKGTLRKYRQGVTAVETPDNIGTWTLRIEKQEVEQSCIEENLRRFTQANNTLPLLPDQIELLGWTGNTTTAKDILEGKEDLIPGLHPLITNMAMYLSTPQAIKVLIPINDNLSIEEYKNMWKRTKE
jgi:hypothetical protein